MSKVSTFLIKNLELKHKEVTIFMLLFFHTFFLGLFIAFYFATANSVFIQHYGSQDLPIAYITAGIAGYLSTFVYSALQKRVQSKTLFLGALIFMLFITILGRMGILYLDVKILSAFVFIWAWPFISLVGIETGGLALKFLNLIQVKRLFGLFNMGGVIAAIISYLAIPVLKRINNNLYDLLYIGMIGLIISIVLLLVMYKKFPESTKKDDDDDRDEQPKLKLDIKSIIKDKYFVWIFVSVIFSTTMIYITDFGFLSSVKIKISSENYAQYLALVYGGLKIGELIISYFSRRLLSKYGVKLGLTILPIVSTFLILGATLVGFLNGAETILFLVLMTLNKSLERILRRGLDDPAFNILYQPLPNEDKLSVQTKVGVVMQFSIAIAGVFLFFTNKLLITDHGFLLKFFPLIFLPILIGWVFASRKLYAAYKAKIRQILADISKEKRRDTAKYQYGDELLKRKLGKESDEATSLSVTILSETNPKIFEAYASNLLEDSNDIVLKKSVLKNIDPTWRSRIKKSIDTLLEKPMPHDLEKLATRASENLDYSAIKAISDEEVAELLKSNKTRDKLKVIKYIFKGRYNPDEKVFLQLLEDEEKVIKASAISLVGRVKTPELIKKLVDFVQSSEYYHISSDVLLEIGDRVVPELERYFEQKAPKEILSRVAEICAKIGSTPAKQLLIKYIDYPDRDVQLDVIWALYFCKFQATENEIPVVKKKLEEIVENILWLYSTIIDIENEKNTLKLFLAIDMEKQLNFELLFQLLSFLHEPRIITLIEKNIIGKNTIFALEIIDNFFSQDVKQIIAPLFDDISSQQKIRQLHKVFPQQKLQFEERLKDIIIREYNKLDTWTISKAIELLGRLHKKHVSKRSNATAIRDYTDIELWTKPNIDEILEKIRRSEMPDEIFVSLYHTDELVYSTAAKIIHEENPIKCFDYLINMSQTKQALMNTLSNNGLLITDKVRLLKRHPLFFKVPENMIVKIAKLVKVKEVKKNEQVFIEYKNRKDDIIIVLKGALVFNKEMEDEAYFFKNDIIIRGTNIDQFANMLVAKKDALLLLINRFEYFNLLMSEKDILRHIFSETTSKKEN